LMQELTEAYRQNDLHTLLRLEMQWIENESDNIERLTEEKLGVYNEVLAGQIDGLEKRLRNLVYHPRYRPIVVFNNGPTRTTNGRDRCSHRDKNPGQSGRTSPSWKPAQPAPVARPATVPPRSAL